MLLNPLASHAVNDGKMAHNIYVYPAFAGTSGKYDAFMVDFRANETPPGTYWALCNFSMDTSGSKELYPGISGNMGAYAGLQNVAPSSGERAIMSFWEVDVGGGLENGSGLRATRVYPAGGESGFGGEGEGNNYLTSYNWKPGKWVRMVLRCWDDPETGLTYIGQWFVDLESGAWTLISVFNTHLKHSFMCGNMSAFMENYLSSYADPERDINLKNYYVLDHEDGEWKTLQDGSKGAGAKLAFDHYNVWKNKRGAHSSGVASDEGGEYFWGKSSGILPDEWNGNTAAYDDSILNNAPASISQPAAPTLPSTEIKNLTLEREGEGWTARWSARAATTPHLSYRAVLFGREGTPLATEEGVFTGAEYKVNLPDVGTDALRCVVEVTDLFGGKVSGEAATAAMGILPGDFNGDNVLSIDDATALLQQLANDSADPARDLTGDGKVTTKDLSRLIGKLEKGE